MTEYKLSKPNNKVRLGKGGFYIKSILLIVSRQLELHGAESLKSLQFHIQSRNSLHFMGPKGSLLHSQELATFPYPEPEQSNPCLPSCSLLRSILIQSSHLSLVFHLAIPFRFPHQNLGCTFPSYMPHSLAISLFLRMIN